MADFVPTFKILDELRSVFINTLYLPLVWLRERKAIFGEGAPRVNSLLADRVVLATEVAEGGLSALELLVCHDSLKVGVDDVSWLVLFANGPNLSFDRENAHHIVCKCLKTLHHRSVT